MKWFIYEFIFHLILLLISPLFLVKSFLRNRSLSHVLNRFGFNYSSDLKKIENLEYSKTIVINACSVGENNAIFPFIEKLRDKFPQLRIIHTVTTTTGYELALKKSKAHLITWYPIENIISNNHFINTFSPDYFIAVETEIWPLMFKNLNDNGVPIFLINGRISDRSFPRYMKLKFIFSPSLKFVNLFLMQSELDTSRIIKMGAESSRVLCLGNIKFDVLEEVMNNENRIDFGFNEGDTIFTFGSMHPGEEKIITGLMYSILDVRPDCKFIIAPRKLHLVKSLYDHLDEESFDYEKRSEHLLSGDKRLKKSILILDTMGELISAYRISCAAFIGGTIVKTGGHNPLEVAACGKPCFFGPHMFNFREIEKIVLKNKIGVRFESGGQAVEEIRTYFLNEEKMAEMGKKGQEIIRKKTGVTDRTLQIISKHIDLTR